MKTVNLDLKPLPSDEAVIAAVRELQDSPMGATAQTLARRLGVQPARRAGRGAVKGSWSGSMAPGLRLSPRLRSLAARGHLKQIRDSYRYEYSVPKP